MSFSTTASPTMSVRSPRSRNVAIASAVVVLHVGALWALQSGLLRRAVEVIVPAQILAEFIEPAPPAAEPKPAPPPPKPQPVVKRETPRPQPAPVPTPMPVASPVPAPAPAPNAPTATTEVPVAAAPAPASAPPAPPAPPPPPRIELPSSNADYLNNPRPAFPALSKRLNEQGIVTLRVFIEVDGRPSRVDIHKSSGFERLDRAARETVLTRWKFVPGKRNGVAEAMWVEVPLNFVLE